MAAIGWRTQHSRSAGTGTGTARTGREVKLMVWRKKLSKVASSPCPPSLGPSSPPGDRL